MRRQLKFITRDKAVDEDWWEWEVLLDEPPAELEKIKSVEYVLHETFPDRIRVKKNADKQFIMKSAGWGEFDIVANVRFKDGEELTQIVPLKLRSRLR